MTRPPPEMKKTLQILPYGRIVDGEFLALSQAAPQGHHRPGLPRPGGSNLPDSSDDDPVASGRSAWITVVAGTRGVTKRSRMRFGCFEIIGRTDIPVYGEAVFLLCIDVRSRNCASTLWKSGIHRSLGRAVVGTTILLCNVARGAADDQGHGRGRRSLFDSDGAAVTARGNHL